MLSANSLFCLCLSAPLAVSMRAQMDKPCRLESCWEEDGSSGQAIRHTPSCPIQCQAIQRHVQPIGMPVSLPVMGLYFVWVGIQHMGVLGG